ncbi:MAG TPA: hypothetical protein VHM26_13175, partial [Chitinophagaceae bacterium]|nr:hypothetical protein [Chitinophagaceae bacterium]
MANKLQLHIPEPCHESWDNMSPVEKGRFCSSCQKQVVDFSVMSDRQIAQFFKQPLTNSVCGHFSGDQLNRDIDLPKKRIPWIKYFFHVAIPAFLISAKAKGQTVLGGIKPTTTCTPDPGIRGDVVYVPVTTEFTVKVTDEIGEPITNAFIRIKSSNKQVKTDALGLFKMKAPANLKEEELTVSSKGYLTAVIKITATEWRRGVANVVLYNPEGMMDGMIVPVKRVPHRPIIDTITNFFTSSKLNPNSIYPGDAFKVEWKSKDEKKIYVSVCDADNKMLLFIPYDAVKGNNSFPVNTDQKWMPGNYTVKLLDVLGKQILSEKLTIRIKRDDIVKTKPIEEPPVVGTIQRVVVPKPVITSIQPGPVVKINDPKTTINDLGYKLAPLPQMPTVRFDNVFACRYPGVTVIKVDETPAITKTPEIPATVISVGKIMPNPVKQGQTFMIEWKSADNAKLSLRITSIDGKELMTLPVAISKGSNRIAVNTDNNWLPGTYIVVLYN